MFLKKCQENIFCDTKCSEEWIVATLKRNFINDNEIRILEETSEKVHFIVHFFLNLSLDKVSVLKIDMTTATLVLQSYRDKYDRTPDTKFCIVCCKFITSSHTFGIWNEKKRNEILQQQSKSDKHFLAARANMSRDSLRLLSCKMQENWRKHSQRWKENKFLQRSNQ